MRVAKFWKSLLVCLVLLAVPTIAVAAELKFSIEPLREPRVVFGDARQIYVEGEIDPGSAERLKRFLDANKVPARSSIYLHSPGGSLLEGVKIGQLIREYGLYTYVGRPGATDSFLSRPGECYSACAIAFLGGQHRWLSDGSRYGVHRFALEKSGPTDSEVSQMLSSVVTAFIREMGVDTKLFDYMAFTSSNDLTVLPVSALRTLRVVDDGVGETKWTLESAASEGIYVKGEQQTWRGNSKFMVACVRRQVGLVVMFDPEGRGDEVLEMEAVSLILDEDTVPIARLVVDRPTLSNGVVNASFLLDERTLDRIIKAKTVGIAFQHAYDAPTFLGFQGMPSVAAGDKIRSLISLCRA